jgi:tRNA-dihydrouridine synthase A
MALEKIPHKPIISIAPMLDLTDRHYRYMMRLLTKQTLLYSEMVTTNAILRGDQERYLGINLVEKPLALQLGGDDPAQLSKCTALAENFGYDEVNLNVGCPSDKVQSGSFGACLMARPDHVTECVKAMKSASSLPITVKHRIGIDGLETFKDLADFVDTVSTAHCDRFIVHARIAILNGLSPKDNRKIPPLRYDDVYQLKKDFPDLNIEINGGIHNFEQAKEHLEFVDGVMMGRQAYERPNMFAEADSLFFGKEKITLDRKEIILQMIPYFEKQMVLGHNLRFISRHLLELMNSVPKARIWRRFISEGLAENPNDLGIFEKSLQILPEIVET